MRKINLKSYIVKGRNTKGEAVDVKEKGDQK